MDGEKQCEFVQRFHVWRGQRRLEIEVELDGDASALGDSPWDHYIASRIAWPDPGASLHRAVCGQRSAAEAKRLEAPLYVEIDSGSTRTALLTGGVPYHRRSSLNELDSLLWVRGETQRSFRLAIGLDLPRVAQAADALVRPPVVLKAVRPASDQGWLLHCDARNTIVTSWRVIEDQPGRAGVALRVQETAGKTARLQLLAPGPITEGSLLNFQGQSVGACETVDGALRWEQQPHQWLEARAFWSAS